MPSLHLSMGFSRSWSAWRRHWALRGSGAGPSLAVLPIGSEHLAWHGAIDGDAAFLDSYLIWWAVGRARREGRAKVQQ